MLKLLNINKVPKISFLNIIVTMITATLCLACATESDIAGVSSLSGSGAEQSGNGNKADRDNKPIGIFLTSHGDIDGYDEIEPYIRSAFLKNVGVPLSKTWREWLQDPAYWLSRDLIEDQYELIGPIITERMHSFKSMLYKQS